MKEQILKEFEDKYCAFELCNQVSKPELDKLKDFLSQAIAKTREETIDEIKRKNFTRSELVRINNSIKEEEVRKIREETIREVEESLWICLKKEEKEIEIQNILEPYFVVLDGRDNEPAQETIIEISKKILGLFNKLKK